MFLSLRTRTEPPPTPCRSSSPRNLPSSPCRPPLLQSLRCSSRSRTCRYSRCPSDTENATHLFLLARPKTSVAFVVTRDRPTDAPDKDGSEDLDSGRKEVEWNGSRGLAVKEHYNPRSLGRPSPVLGVTLYGTSESETVYRPRLDLVW